MSTCISLIRQYVPASDTSGWSFAHVASRLFIVEAFNTVVVDQREIRLDHIPYIFANMLGQEEPECTAAYASGL